MARAALGWHLRDLAEASGVSANTIVRVEKGGGTHAATQAAIRRALEDAGIRFIEEDDHGGPGVRLRGSREIAPRYSDKEALKAIGISAEAFLAEHPDVGMSVHELIGHAVVEAGSSIQAAQQLYFEQFKFFEHLIATADDT